MTDNQNDAHALGLMLGEIRGDVKWLVDERRASSRRMDDIEAGIEKKIDEHHDRLTRLEGFKVRIGVLATGLGFLVPTAITVVAKALGLL